MDPNRVQVAPFGPKLCQNDAPDLRIILGALLGPKTQLEKNKNRGKKKHQNPDFYVSKPSIIYRTPEFYR